MCVCVCVCVCAQDFSENFYSYRKSFLIITKHFTKISQDFTNNFFKVVNCFPKTFFENFRLTILTKIFNIFLKISELKIFHKIFVFFVYKLKRK